MGLIKTFFSRAFFGVNITQFFDTFSNNFFRNAITAAVMFGAIALESPQHSAIVSALAVGLLMLPSFLFMATAGEIADKYPKDVIIKALKILQLIASVLACVGFVLQNVYILLAVVFIMGTFAAILSTVKYSILPDILPQGQLLSANAIIQMMVYVAILAGTIVGGIIFSVGAGWLYGIILASAILGLVSAFVIPKQKALCPNNRIDMNLARATWNNVSFAYKDTNIFICILAVSWFWFLGTVLISQIPAFAKETINGNDEIFTFFIVLFSVGVGLGSILCQMILKGEISNKYAMVSLLMITLFLGDLAYVAANFDYNSSPFNLKYFLMSLNGIRISFDIFAFSLCGGVYVVPITTMIQTLSKNEDRSRNIAANNIVNALFMVIGSGLCAILLALGVSIPAIFAILAAVNVVALLMLHRYLKERGKRK